ncbi:MAG: site-2 protease family protein [Firmicutes bacterium]|nr:site-2 protease family protein [Bacillota bacterium]
MYQAVLRLPVLLIAITVHEYAHARVAYYYGDPTAKAQGRLSLNPLVHLDPLGALMLLTVGIGWAKPVPINPYNFRDYRSGLLWVSFAGPLANFILAFASLFLLRIVRWDFIGGQTLFLLLYVQATINIALGVFNLVPVPPLDGSKIFASLARGPVLAFYRRFEPYAPLLLVVLLITGFLGRIIWPVTEIIKQGMLRILQFIS